MNTNKGRFAAMFSMAIASLMEAKQFTKQAARDYLGSHQNEIKAFNKGSSYTTPHTKQALAKRRIRSKIAKLSRRRNRS